MKEFVRLVVQLESRGSHPDNLLAARLLKHNVRLFLRPSEWSNATIEANLLVIKNAKATNGRSFATHRHLDLKEYGENGVNDLSRLLTTLKQRAKTPESFRQLWSTLAARIAVHKSGHKEGVALFDSSHWNGYCKVLDVAGRGSCERGPLYDGNSDRPLRQATRRMARKT